MADKDLKEEIELKESSRETDTSQNSFDHTKEYNSMMNRLKRIEGQIRGLERLLAEDSYFSEILVQVMAVNKALNSFSKELLAIHIKTYVKNELAEGRDDSVDELISVFQKLMK